MIKTMFRLLMVTIISGIDTCIGKVFQIRLRHVQSLCPRRVILFKGIINLGSLTCGSSLHHKFRYLILSVGEFHRCLRSRVAAAEIMLVERPSKVSERLQRPS